MAGARARWHVFNCDARAAPNKLQREPSFAIRFFCVSDHPSLFVSNWHPVSILLAFPFSGQVDPLWQAALERSSDTHGDSWLHQLHLGVAAAEEGNMELGTALPAPLTVARSRMELSTYMRPNPVALRTLALFAPDSASAWALYTQVSL